jgi:membrane-associated phospholipid phosphatase
MTAAEYQKIYRWFSARPAARRALVLLTRWLPRVSMAMYPLLLVLLAGRVAAEPGGEARALLVRAVCVPGGVFVGGTLLRHCLNFPRPYEQPGFEPLLRKNTQGHSFPSRHALSAAVIAMAWLRVCPPVGGALIALTLALCVTRVLAGVHFARDVAAGAALGFALGALGMFL